MLSALELCRKKARFRKERETFEDRIEEASDSDSEELWDAQGIISPFTPGYVPSPAVRLWLEEWGWKFEDDHIKAILEEERYIP